MVYDARSIVATGAALLDEKLPSWERSIDLEALDLWDGESCILGQLYGSYHRGREILGLVYPHTNKVIALGFKADEGLATHASRTERYDALKAVWVHEVQQRLAA